MAVVDDLKRLGELVSLSDDALSGLSIGDLSEAVALTNRVERHVGGFMTRVASALSRAEAAGSAPPAAEVLRGKHGEVSAARARQLLDRSTTSEQFAAIDQRVQAGEARGENVDAIARQTANLNPGERERLNAIGEEIAERAVNLPPETFDKYLTRTVRRIRDPIEAGPSIVEQQRAASRVGIGRRRNGMWWLSGELDPERGALLDNILRTTTRTLSSDGSVDDHTRAEALVTGQSNGTPSPGLGNGDIVDAQTLLHGPHDNSIAQTGSGDHTNPETVQRLSCNADLFAVLIDDLGQPTRAGLTHRTATREQRLQLRALYETCAIDGATPFDRCEIHHVNVFHQNGGQTELDNLLPISTQGHHNIHDRGWTIKMGPDRALKNRQPNGQPHRTIPPPTPITRQLE